MIPVRIILLLALSITFRDISAQNWNYERLKSHFSNTKTTGVEGFYELDSDRKYIIGIVKNSSLYQIVYLFGNSENWKDGDIRGFIENKNNQLIVKWDGSANPGTIPLFSLKIQTDSSGFYLKYPDDTPDYFRKINSLECEMAIRKYTSTKSVKMSQTNSGVYEIPASINNVLKIYLILDTGASDVSISPDVVLTLMKSKAIGEDDWLEGRYYKFADGSVAKSGRFVIRTLKIGDAEIKNVEASISNSIDAPLLLGQSALSKLGKIQIDYINHLFTIIK